MFRSITERIVWVGRVATFLVGLAVILALAFGTAATALAGSGVGGVFNLGQTNRVDAITRLIGVVTGPGLAVSNTATDPAATALDLRVRVGHAPMTVNSRTVVANLNADLLDGMDPDDLAEPRGYANVLINGGFDPARSKGINSVVVSTEPTAGTNTYCFDLAFAPKIAVASPFLANSAVVATTTAPNPMLTNDCPDTHEDAAARTFGSSANPERINFQIIFV